MIQTSDSFRRLATAAAFASLTAYATVLFITPACMNEIKGFYHASDGQVGLLYLAIMAGFFVAVLWAGGYSDKHGKLPAIAAGCVCMTAGALLFAWTSRFEVAIAAMFLAGMGGGASEGVCMALISDLYEDSKRISMANLSQSVFGVGAISASLGIGWLIKSHMSWRIGYLGSALECAIAAAIAIWALTMRQETPVSRRGECLPWNRLMRDKLILCLALGLLLYVGAELGQSNWLAGYFKRHLGADPALAAQSLSAMWAGIWCGRMSAAWLSRHMSGIAMIRCGLALAAVCEASLLLLRTPMPGLAAAFGLGLGLGPVFPTVTSITGAAYSAQSGTATWIVVAAGSLGAAIFPPLIGLAADHIGLRSALWTCFAVLVINLGIFLSLRVPAGKRDNPA